MTCLEFQDSMLAQSLTHHDSHAGEAGWRSGLHDAFSGPPTLHASFTASLP